MPDLSADELATQYGMTASFFDAFPELKDLLQQAVSGQWTPDKFSAKFKNTDWWKSRPDANRKAWIQQYTDPATADRTWRQTLTHAQVLAGQMGANSSDTEMVGWLATKMMWYGWSDEEANNYLGRVVQFGKGNMTGGKAGQVEDELNAYAYSMGVQNSDAWTRDAVTQIASGVKTSQEYKNQILYQSIAAFPQFQKQLEGGATLESLAQPYTQSMSQILEIPQGQINMFDPTIRKAMGYRNTQGQAETMPLWDFQNQLRQDPRWAKTQNAQDAAMGTAHKVLQDFGFYY